MNVKIKYIWIKEYSKPTTINYHFHNFHEIIYYMEADGYSSYFLNSEIPKLSMQPLTENITYAKIANNHDEKKLSFCDKTIAYFAPGVLHNEINPQPTKLVAIGFELDTTFAINLNTGVFKDEGKSIGKIIKKIVDEYLAKKTFYMSSIKNYLSIIFVELLRLSNFHLQNDSPLINAIRYMEDYFASKIDYDQLAKLAGYCPEHFRFLFKKEMGVSPKKFIMNKRLSYAKSMLENTNLPIQDISASCGFSDFPQFSTFFKKCVGHTPSKYRLMFQEKALSS